MTICHAILTPIVTLVRTFVQVVHDVVRTVCEWVSSVIRTVRTVVERVCSWLPWPLDAICNLVTRTIEVFETVWEWVCREVIERVIEWVEQIIEYVSYILRWVCWAVDWVVRGPELLLCLLGLRPKRFLHICIRVLTDADGAPAVDSPKVQADVRQATAILARCDIELVVLDTQLVEKPELLDGTTCDFSGMFTDFFTWFSRNACSGCSAVTVFYVRSIPDAIGCAYPGSTWVTVAAGGDGRTMVQEIGHLCDLWAHSSDPNNVMTDQGGGTADQITSEQCCMFATSRFSLTTPCPEAEIIGREEEELMVEALQPREARALSHAFQKARVKGPTSQLVPPSRVTQALVAGLVVVGGARAVYRRIRR